ncbi:Protein of unknown function DUF1064 [uncultured Caudovirales phage]|uniref:DUF1064 domain-containing protein n=1 Tax=uncultured Caudovirales phage TaxID=2100421 RepID=A0A6J5PXK6_9CAUD|nr:Protein of unknown function DUF1064 [uncultured Caudovirales phage]CAB4176640.1 Protein of unknown function DUF1064 [uncultured Caudovirales phage]CAB4190300.1 Protein of unknown function DUF1064 [uncultured Caudovirales phage]
MTATARQQLADAMKATKKGRFPRSPAIERTVDGRVFDSKREAARYSMLRMQERNGLISHLECQPSWRVEIQGKRFCTYSADFSYFRKGVLVIEDVKSSGTAKDPAYRLRKKAAELSFHIKVTEVLS